MDANSDHIYPQIAGRVRVSALASPHGDGVVISQTPWTAVVRMDADGRDYEFGKSVIDPIQ